MVGIFTIRSKEKSSKHDNEIPQLNHVNYIWVTNLMNNSSELKILHVDELVEWDKNRTS